MKPELELKLKPVDSDGQFRIESNFDDLEGEWRDIYVSFSGYSGSYSPKLFLHAPDLLDAIKELLHHANASVHPTTFSQLGAIGRASALVNKIEGTNE